MPIKKDPDATYGQKLIRLFADLLFTGKRKSLSELAKMLKSSKPTVLRLVNDITQMYSVIIHQEIIDGQKYFWIERPKKIPLITMSSDEITALEMGRAFARNLLGEAYGQCAETGLQKNMSLLPEDEAQSWSHEFFSLADGQINYTQFREMLDKLMKAKSEQKVCCVQYQKLMADEPKTVHIMPLTIFSHKDTIYIHSRYCTKAGLPDQEKDADLMLPLHRFHDVQVVETTFDYPKKFDFMEAFAGSFGLIQKKVFKAEVEFTGWSARFVKERQWSPDQKIVKKRDGSGIRLEFLASSDSELIGWVLSFGDEAQLLKPARVRKKLVKKLEGMVAAYR